MYNYMFLTFHNTSRVISGLPFTLVFIACLYGIGYIVYSKVHPLGWWGWFDQGKYLTSSYALLQHDLSPDKHFYPPLYPAIGAIFLRWSSSNPYYVPNLLCLLWFAFVFIRVSDRYIPRWGSLILFYGTTIINIRIFECYLIPWTTTLSVAFIATGILGLVWLQEIMDGKLLSIEVRHVLFVSTFLGLLVPTRPGDAIAVGGVLGLALISGYWYVRKNDFASISKTSVLYLLIIICSAIGSILFIAFNSAVFGTFYGGYLQAATGNGFYISDLAEKFVSIWLDASVLYNEPHTSLTERYPWLFISLAGMIWVLFKSDFLMRVLALSITTLYVLYMPYGDLLPNGLWRYYNIHYFKWTFPFLALFGWILVKDLLFGIRLWKGWLIPSLVIITIPTLLLSLQLNVSIKSTVMNYDARGINIKIESSEVDFLDFDGLYGEFREIYFGNHRLLLDGRELKSVRDFRLLPINNGVRLLFIRPISGKSILFIPDIRLNRHDQLLRAYVGVYEIVIGFSKLLRNINENI